MKCLSLQAARRCFSLVALLLIFAVGCSNQQIDGWESANNQIAAATTQPYVTAGEDFPVIGDYVKAGAGFVAAFLHLWNPVLDLLRPPVAAVAR